MQDSSFGIAVTIFTLGGLLGSLAGDEATRRLGRVGVLRTSEVVFAIGTACVGLANNIAPVIVGRSVPNNIEPVSEAHDQDHDRHRLWADIGDCPSPLGRHRSQAVQPSFRHSASNVNRARHDRRAKLVDTFCSTLRLAVCATCRRGFCSRLAGGRYYTRKSEAWEGFRGDSEAAGR